jgi:hypothetical protein
MKIIGCDLHTRYQQIAMLDAETGELMERLGCPTSRAFREVGRHTADTNCFSLP